MKKTPPKKIPPIKTLEDITETIQILNDLKKEFERPTAKSLPLGWQSAWDNAFPKPARDILASVFNAGEDMAALIYELSNAAEKMTGKYNLRMFNRLQKRYAGWDDAIEKLYAAAHQEETAHQEKIVTPL